MKLSSANWCLRGRIALLCVSSMLPASGCVASDAAKSIAVACDQRIIVRFQNGVDPTDKDVLSQIGSRIHAVLTYDHAIGGDQHVLQLSARASCEQALSALQHDEKVVNAESDTIKRATH